MAATNEDQENSLREGGTEPESAPAQETGKYFWKARTDHQSGDWMAQFGISQSPWVPNPTVDARFTPRTILHDLKDYTPTRLEFTLPHAESERKDSWFEETFKHLYWTTYSFSVRRLGQHSFHLSRAQSPWMGAKLSAQFVSYASQLSRQDPLFGGWDLLLKDKRHRVILVTGILSKVLVNNVLSDLLWGATDEQTALLKAHDAATVSEDGYKRTKRRADMVRDALGGHILTPNFWSRVGELATRTTSLLLPLINFQGQQAPAEKWPGLMVIYQELHDIIAEAAYFSICIRLSHTIFKIEYPEPGEKWELTYGQLEEKHIYRKSKMNAQDHDARQGHPSARVAKVKVVAWPEIKRHEPLGSVEDYGAEAGERVALVSRCEVAYYFGRSDDQGEMWERKPTLAEHIMASSKKKNTARRSKQALLSFVILTILGLLVNFALLALGPDPLSHGYDIISHGIERFILASTGGHFQKIQTGPPAGAASEDRLPTTGDVVVPHPSRI
ncbi:hypothetical protein MAPG_06833 [Magnaporthiopsis poae ATCC 64411]|uniref:Uncharacterized protein n=1 Tax=Magnaporthiopsis poae (strain ATCC 64411 / 73-15) TaxID=644358 RepID=A0A0C4E341_MAGP6|nr:hypothetical protein MAPG_06833 [Magnaporthiopsis poae ATCC 64411]